MSDSRRTERRTLAMVTVVGLLLPLVISGRAIAANHGDPTILIGFGSEDIATRTYAEDRLGEVFLRSGQGHDGKFFFVQANDPLLLRPDENAAVLDRPRYRSQRMLYPLIAGGFGSFPSEVIVWSLLIVNLFAFGLGAWVVGRIALSLGGSAWLGLAFPWNLGLISEMLISGAGIVASCAAFAAVWFALRGRLTGTIVLVAIAALTREAMLITAAGIAIWYLFRRERRSAVLVFSVPLAAVGLWALYLRARIGPSPGGGEIEEIGLPFVGFLQAFASWVGEPLDLAVGVAIMALLLAFAWRVSRGRELVGWAFVGFVGLAILFTEQVWHSYFDITRAVAPAITAFVVLVLIREKSDVAEVNEQVFG